MSHIPYVLSGDTLNVAIPGGKSYLVRRDNFEAFDELLTALRDDSADVEAITNLLDVQKALSFAVDGFDDITVTDGAVLYKGEPIDNSLCTRIIEMTRQGFDAGPLVRFLSNLMLNPSSSSVRELYGFLGACQMPLTEDGHFIAYKIVKEDYTDIYTGKMDNSPGKRVWMLRNQVDDDRTRTCSRGLHACSKTYLPNYGSLGGSDRVVILKINPAHVVSVPTDYNNAKMRVSEYFVLGELHDKQKLDIFDRKGVFRTADYAGNSTSWAQNEGSSDEPAGFDEEEEEENYGCVGEEEEGEETTSIKGDDDNAGYTLFVEDSHEEGTFYEATINDIRDGEKLYVYDDVHCKYVPLSDVPR